MDEVTRPDIILVVAAADNDVIGRDGRMPWHVPEDLRRFRRMTVGHPVVMGRKTFDSIGKPLPGRHNIVLTRDPSWRAEGVTAVPNLAEAIAAAGLDPRARAPSIFVIGGAEIYALAMPIATRIELTRVHASPEGDTRFPRPDPGQWALQSATPGEGVTFETWQRRTMALEPGSARL
ncbi:dihydrofolate reductase [Thermaurantiacus sp.]